MPRPQWYARPSRSAGGTVRKERTLSSVTLVLGFCLFAEMLGTEPRVLSMLDKGSASPVVSPALVCHLVLPSPYLRKPTTWAFSCGPTGNVRTFRLALSW
jgi:hypothetical protein